MTSINVELLLALTFSNPHLCQHWRLLAYFVLEKIGVEEYIKTIDTYVDVLSVYNMFDSIPDKDNLQLQHSSVIFSPKNVDPTISKMRSRDLII